MQYAISLEFLNAYSSLSKSDQKNVRQTLGKVSVDYEGSGLRLHKLEHPSGKMFSYSVNKDIRIIVHKETNQIDLLYVDHHDTAYEWLQRRKFVRIGDTLRIIVTDEEDDLSSLLKSPSSGQLDRKIEESHLQYHKEQLAKLTSEEECLDYIVSLSFDDIEKDELLVFTIRHVMGYRLLPITTVQPIADDQELMDALKYPLDLWRVFLHPTQREIAYSPIRQSHIVTGGPGTGKTVVLMHRIKHVVSQIAPDEKVLLTTYKSELQSYLVSMLEKLAINMEQVLIVDISEIKRVTIDRKIAKNNKVVLSSLEQLEILSEISLENGCFLMANNHLYFRKDGIQHKIRYLLVDEYQDYKHKQIQTINELMEWVPCTISLDYSQAIYRPLREMAQELVDKHDSVEYSTLELCYRLNDQVLKRIKSVISTIRVMAIVAKASFKVDILPIEEELVDNLQPAVRGKAPTIFRYQSTDDDLTTFLVNQVAILRQEYEPCDLVVTAFMRDLYKYGQEGKAFGSNLVPEQVRPYYQFIYTLKGQEFKAGIVILDETICQLMNLNQSVFSPNLPDGLLGKSDNVRRMLNLLYVALSRFRDGLIICYPERYALIMDPIFDLESN